MERESCIFRAWTICNVSVHLIGVNQFDWMDWQCKIVTIVFFFSRTGNQIGCCHRIKTLNGSFYKRCYNRRPCRRHFAYTGLLLALTCFSHSSFPQINLCLCSLTTSRRPALARSNTLAFLSSYNLRIPAIITVARDERDHFAGERLHNLLKDDINTRSSSALVAISSL
jgi:hypothetical protein